MSQVVVRGLTVTIGESKQRVKTGGGGLPPAHKLPTSSFQIGLARPGTIFHFFVCEDFAVEKAGLNLGGSED